MKGSHYLDFFPHGGPGIPHIVSHLVTQKSLDMLRLDPVGVLALHGLPGGVVEPGPPHDLQPGTWPVHAVALPLLQDRVERFDSYQFGLNDLNFNF